ncbi:hypothetical protein UlMin_006855 [Ulmus minor]
MKDTLFYTVSIPLVILVIFLIQRRRKQPKYNLPPSPPSLPIIGHLHLLKPPVLMHRIFFRLSQKYGPIFTLWFGSRRVLVVTTPSAVEECFTKNDVILANRPPLLLGKHLDYNYTTIVQSPYGDHWRNLRRMGALEIFSTSRLNAFLGIRRDEIKRMLRNLAKNSINNFSKVELKSMFLQLTFNMTLRMVAGKRYYGDDVANKDEAHRFEEIMNEVFFLGGSANLGDFVPVYEKISGNSYEKRVMKVAKKMDEFLQGFIDEIRNRGKGGNSMIDHLLSLQDQQPEYYTDQIIKGFIQILLLAGTDTSAVTLEWAMTSLLNNPHVLKKAKEEVDANFSQDQLLDEPDIAKLPYIQNIIFEALRLFPATPILVPHYSSDDCTVSGYDVPRGTIIFVNAWAIQRDPKLWVDAESFMPERYEGPGGEKAQKLVMTFGLGRRACPGAPLAHRIMGLTLGLLIQCFDWERVDEKLVDLAEGSGITMPKVVPLEAMCKARPIINTVLAEPLDEN